VGDPQPEHANASRRWATMVVCIVAPSTGTATAPDARLLISEVSRSIRHSFRAITSERSGKINCIKSLLRYTYLHGTIGAFLGPLPHLFGRGSRGQFFQG